MLKSQYLYKLPYFLLTLLIITYTIYFSWYTINRHNTLNSYAADLSLIDQPMWNTARGPGGFMEQTWGNRQQPRLAEHFEPILVPLATLFFIWSDVRILLIAQSFALAIGALPVFWIAKDQLTINNEQLTTPQLPITNYQLPTLRPSSEQVSNLQPFDFAQDRSPISNWIALTFSLAYLLFPHLQAANIADFHADPFVVAPLLFSFWYATQHRWRWMWLWAIIAMLTKENLPTLTAMLGVWLLARSAVGGRRSAFWHGLSLILISAAWFLVATFLIVAPLARQYFGSEGPIYFASRFSGEGVAWPDILTDPVRWKYLLGLFAAAGFLPLLAPELLILGLPVLIANLLSNFPGQYSGEQHYSAPLVAAFIVAAIYGLRRLTHSISLRKVNNWSLRNVALVATSLWLLAWSLGYHAVHGWTPLSIRAETYQATAAATQLPRLLDQVSSDAIVTASAAVHPHLAHRQTIYVFPTVENADTLLVDVTDIPGAHPFDAHAKIMDMLSTNWQLVEANQGLILAQKLSANASQSVHFPTDFYGFTHPVTSPMYPTPLSFGDGRLKLLGYDALDDPDDGVVFGFHWQATDTLPADFKLWPLVYDDTGHLLTDPTQVPMIATVWHPPEDWQIGETVATETLPQLLPDTFHLGIAAGVSTDSFYDETKRWPVSNADKDTSLSHPGRWVQLASFMRQGNFLAHLSPQPSLQRLAPLEANFESAINLDGFWIDTAALRPESEIDILLQWSANRPQQTDYTVFVHLLAPDGSLAAQNDAFPTWLMPQPTSQWPTDQPTLDHHTLKLPADLPVGTYTLHVGLYNAQTQERLLLFDGSDTVQLAKIRIQ